jgi:hypothetical protein
MSIAKSDKKRIGWILPPPDLETKPKPCRELWSIFCRPNCSDISRDFSRETGIKKSEDAVQKYFSGDRKDIPSQFMDWARTKRKSPAQQAGEVSIAKPLKINPPADGCQNHGVCANFSMLLATLAQFVAVSARLNDPDRRKGIEDRIESLTLQVEKELEAIRKGA